jgi:hypothetical protein
VKLVALWLSVLIVAAITAGSCSISHRSGDYSCQSSADCSDGRICSDGLCILTSAIDAGGKGDGGQVVGDAGVCPSPCTSCDPGGKGCKIDCSLNGGCNFPVVCPTGWTCEVDCTTNGSCRSGITCSDKACKVECSGVNTCRNVTCGTGPCNLDCAGRDSCNTVHCATSCACDVTCGADTACDDLNCTQLQCETFTGPADDGCSSMNPGCNTCKSVN